MSVETQIAKDFLLAEHQYFSTLLRENEALGERRMQFFMGLVAAVIAGITALASVEKGLFLNNPIRVAWAALAGSTLLLIVGFLTYERLRKRDNTTDEYKQILDKVRANFGVGSQWKPLVLTSYQPFADLKQEERKGQLTRMSQILTGLVGVSILMEVAYLAFMGQYLALEMGAALVAGFFVGWGCRAIREKQT